MVARTLMVVTWPAFLAACLLELFVFAVVDPLDLRWAGHALGWSRADVYTAAFFVFWAAAIVACALSLLLRAPYELAEPLDAG
ncbi:MAG: hypothetical protein ACXWC6_03620 [Ramlibacter sp.]